MIVDAMWLAALLTLGVTSERTFGPASSGAVFVGSTPCGHEIRRFVGIAPRLWSVVRGTTDPTRPLYRLDSDWHAAFLSLVRADEHVLPFVDDDGGLLKGNSDFSYTLNRSQPSP